MQRSKQVAMGRKKFNMDPKKVRERLQPAPVLGKVGGAQGLGEAPANGCQPCPLARSPWACRVPSVST